MKFINDISSYDQYTDLFKIHIRSESDSDGEYMRDFYIDWTESINWKKILEQNNFIPDYNLIDKLKEAFENKQPFELSVNYYFYDASIREIRMSDYHLNIVNDILTEYMNSAQSLPHSK